MPPGKPSAKGKLSSSMQPKEEPESSSEASSSSDNELPLPTTGTTPSNNKRTKQPDGEEEEGEKNTAANVEKQEGVKATIQKLEKEESTSNDSSSSSEEAEGGGLPPLPTSNSQNVKEEIREVETPPIIDEDDVPKRSPKRPSANLAESNEHDQSSTSSEERGKRVAPAVIVERPVHDVLMKRHDEKKSEAFDNKLLEKLQQQEEEEMIAKGEEIEIQFDSDSDHGGGMIAPGDFPDDDEEGDGQQEGDVNFGYSPKDNSQKQQPAPTSVHDTSSDAEAFMVVHAAATNAMSQKRDVPEGKQGQQKASKYAAAVTKDEGEVASGKQKADGSFSPPEEPLEQQTSDRQLPAPTTILSSIEVENERRRSSASSAPSHHSETLPPTPTPSALQAPQNVVQAVTTSLTSMEAPPFTPEGSTSVELEKTTPNAFPTKAPAGKLTRKAPAAVPSPEPKPAPTPGGAKQPTLAPPPTNATSPSTVTPPAADAPGGKASTLPSPKPAVAAGQKTTVESPSQQSPSAKPSPQPKATAPINAKSPARSGNVTSSPQPKAAPTTNIHREMDEWDQVTQQQAKRNEQVVEEGVQRPNLPMISFAESYHQIRDRQQNTWRQYKKEDLKRVGANVETTGCLACLWSCFHTDIEEGSADYEERDFILCLQFVPFDHANDIHQRILITIYRRLTKMERSAPDPRTVGEHWVKFGFQNVNPANDLRGSGLFGLLQMLYLLDFLPTFSKAMWETATSSMTPFDWPLVVLQFACVTYETLKDQNLHDAIAAKRKLKKEVFNVKTDEGLIQFAMEARRKIADGKSLGSEVLAASHADIIVGEVMCEHLAGTLYSFYSQWKGDKDVRNYAQEFPLIRKDLRPYAREHADEMLGKCLDGAKDRSNFGVAKRKMNAGQPPGGKRSASSGQQQRGGRSGTGGQAFTDLGSL